MSFDEGSSLGCPVQRLWARLSFLLLLMACGSIGSERGVSQANDDEDLLTSVIARGPNCEQCTVEIKYLGRLGSDADTMLMTPETMIAERKDGAFIAAPLSRDGEAVIFDSLGSVGRPYGHPGEGPGENGRILNVLPWLGDSILFAGFSRLTFLSGDRGRGRTTRLERPSPSHRTVALLQEGTVVRNYSYPPDRQFVVFNKDGTIRFDIGLGWGAGSGRDVYAMLAELGPAQDPYLFWSAPQRYQVQMDLWDSRSGTRVRQFKDSVSWYTPYDSAALYQFILDGNDAENPPPPFLRGIRESADSVLLLLYNIPARNWAPIRDTLPPLLRRLRPEAFDAVLDIRDPSSGESLIALWTNHPFARIVNDSLLADRRQTDEGFWVYDIYQMVFRR